MTTPCPRLFEAEAMRDGRLAGTERTSFERHMTVCRACSREVESFETLAAALRASPEDKDADELRVRRERTRLLAAFDSSLVAPERRWRARQLLWPVAVAALVALFVFWRIRPAAQAVHAPSTVIDAEGAALWSKRTEDNRDKVVLERGALRIRVTHTSGQAPLLVVLPDGELEDTGTIFTVSAEEGHTTRVAVEEGSVVLRVRGQPPITIGAGDTWVRDARPAAPVVTSSAPPVAPPPSARLAPAARSAPPPRSPEPPASAVSPDPSDDFRAAMAALDRGDNREAAAGFTTFFEKHPQDPRAEDAAYLRVFALQRCRDSSGMKEAALEYLRRYPAGFRRAEVESLSR